MPEANKAQYHRKKISLSCLYFGLPRILFKTSIGIRNGFVLVYDVPIPAERIIHVFTQIIRSLSFSAYSTAPS